MVPVQSEEDMKVRSVSCLERLVTLLTRRKEEENMKATNEKLMELLKPVRYKPHTVDQV